LVGPAEVVFPDLEQFATRVKEILLEEDGQAIWSILAQKLDWHLSLCYPTDISDAAAELECSVGTAGTCNQVTDGSNS
jgi:hypothetical protein